MGNRPIGLEMVLRCPRGHRRGDATNYLRGIADVLEDKSHRTGQLDLLGDLRDIHLYDNDRQLEEISFTWREAVDASYLLTLRGLEN